jgi:hypothetical protein
MEYHQAQNIFYCGASGEPVGLGCQAGNREILTIMGAKSGPSKFPAAPKSRQLFPDNLRQNHLQVNRIKHIPEGAIPKEMQMHPCRL